ncbi:MAG: heavy metal translocating P-type ATPase, partial [Alphaproteobacteria bacterium]
MNVHAPLDGFADGEPERLHEFSRAEILHASRVVGDNMRRTDLSVPTIHCGDCLRKIERVLGVLDGVESARVNLSTKRVSVLWRTDCVMPPFVQKLMDLGHEPHLEDSGTDTKDKTLSELVRALAVAGFATANIMALSVAVWSGAEPAARSMFHWVSALIALPALVYSGRVFFRSAFRALRHGTTNMDVPISVGVILAFGLSLFDTIRHGEAAYFEASVMLLFFLLIGRTLDHLMRERARRAVTGLARLVSRAVQVVRADGRREMFHLSNVEPGMTIVVSAGERIPVNGRVVSGVSELDCALVSGESMPQPVSAGMVVQAGMLNLTGPLTLSTIAAEKDSFLAEMARLMATAEAGRSTYRRISDRAAGLYTPLVHAAALASFAGWMVAGGDVHRAVTIAVAVLIITCPCALGLAVPMVHVVAARRLFEHGILVKDGGAL